VRISAARGQGIDRDEGERLELARLDETVPAAAYQRRNIGSEIADVKPGLGNKPGSVNAIERNRRLRGEES
jgi:hypothetical protein